MNFELVLDANAELAETPIWDKRNGCLYWTGMFECQVCEYNPATGKERKWDVKKLIGSAVPAEDPSKILVILEDGIHLLDKDSGGLTRVADPEPGRSENRFNDARVDARGRIFASTVAKTYGSDKYTPDQRGNFYMIEKNGKITTIAKDINQYNCIVWRSDNKKMFVVDTYNCTLLEWDYDLDSGPVGRSRVAIDFKGAMPDGLSIDVEDNLYVCHWNGTISVWDKNYQHKETIKFPVEQVCCGGFGGADMKDFYVATARYAYTPEQMADRRGAGGLFKARSPIAGAQEHFY